MKVLVLNCGSSSIKFQLLNMNNAENGEVLAKGLVERVGAENGEVIFTGTKKYQETLAVPNHAFGVSLILDLLSTASKGGVLASLDEIDGFGHRVAHGGEYFRDSARIDAEVLHKIELCSELAPLHNPANLKGIQAVCEKYPEKPQVAVFDTAFHQTLPPQAYMYGIDYKLYEELKVRKYGFHGTSHKYVAQKACDILGWDITKKKIVSCHLGNGASVCAIKYGKSIETSMGFTPNEGLLMGTRTGNLDLGALLYIAEKKNKNLKELNDMINKESGLVGVSGISSDMRDLEEAASQGNSRAQLALDMFSYRVKRFVGSYAAALGGMDLLLFTGGIGENDMAAREAICSEFEYMGLEFDKEKNQVKGKDTVISKDNSATIAMVVTTNEELVIAKDTVRLLTQK